MKNAWEVRRLGDICKYDKTTNKKSNIPYVGLEDIESNTGRFVGTLNAQQVKSTTFHFNDNHVLYGRLRPYLNKVLLPDFEGHCSSEIFPIRVDHTVLRKYLFYWLTSDTIVEKINTTCTGARMPRANMKEVINFKILIPPLPEQQQIVNILDQAFAAIDKAKANIERNLQNTKELFQSELNKVFSQKGEGWETKTINEVTQVINGFSFKSKDFSPDNPVKAVKITNVGVREFVEDESNNLPAEFADINSGVRVQSGDIVLALTRTIIAAGLKVARIPESYDQALVNQRVAALKPRKQFISSTYLYYYFCTKQVADYVLSNVNTLMQPNLSIADLKSMPVPVCSIEEQGRIKRKIHTLFIQSNSLEEKYRDKLRAMHELKKSILQKTFTGELTANKYKLTDIEELDMVAEK